MNKTKLLVLSFVGLIGLTTTAAATIQTISAADLNTAIQNGATMKLIDVRSATAFNSRHIFSASNIYYSSASTFITACKNAGLNKSVETIVYGQNSADTTPNSAATALMNNGYTHVLVYQGGLDEWVSLGYQTLPF